MGGSRSIATDAQRSIWVTNGSTPTRPSLSQVPQKANGIAAAHKQARQLGARLPVLCKSAHGGFRRPPPAGRVTLSCASGAAEPLRVLALRVSIVAAEPIARQSVQKERLRVRPVPSTRPPAIKERSFPQLPLRFCARRRFPKRRSAALTRRAQPWRALSSSPSAAMARLDPRRPLCPIARFTTAKLAARSQRSVCPSTRIERWRSISHAPYASRAPRPFGDA